MVPKNKKKKAKSGASAVRKRAAGSASASGKRASGPTDRARERAAALLHPSLAVVFKDPLRVQIMAIATQRAISPSEFARESGCTLGAASYHFRMLREADVLEVVERVRVRGTTRHMHKATSRPVVADADFGRLGRTAKSGISGAVLQDLNARVSQALEAGTLDAREDSVFLWDGLVFDETSWPRFIEVLSWAYEEALALEVDTVERRAEGKSKESIPATIALAGFESPKQSEVKRRNGA